MTQSFRTRSSGDTEGRRAELFRACLRPLLFCGLWAGAFSGFSFGAQQWTAPAPVPSWVREETVPESEATPDAAKWGDSRYLLVEDQVRTSRSDEARYFHRAQQVISPRGISDVSEVVLSFDPSYERLEIHSIRIHRGDRRIDALDPAQLKTLQQEKELDRRIYNGALQVVAMLPDVRVGDVVEWSWTTSGRNPALGDHHADWWRLGYSTPVAKLRLRILSSGRPLRFRQFQGEVQPTVTRQGETTEYRWAVDDVPAEVYEDDQPAWRISVPTLQVTDFETWAEVADWAEQRYRPLRLTRERMPEELRAKVAEWEALGSKAERTQAALQFVQDEVRYLGIEIGSSGLIPHDPASVFERRFGDCKDKSLLLVSILNAMGIEADTALVDVDWGAGVEEMLPSPYLFDHEIAVARIGGQSVWLDATQSMQRGALLSRTPPAFGKALVISGDTTALETIPSPAPAEPLTEIVEEYAVQPDGSVAFTVTTTYRGTDADSMRYSFAGQSHAELARDYLNFYARTDADVEPAGALEIRDDEAANVLTAIERYRIPKFWSDGQRKFDAWALKSALSWPDVRARSTPLAVEHPVWVRQTIHVTGIGRITTEGPTTKILSEGLVTDFEETEEADGVKLMWQARSLRDHIPPEGVTEYLSKLDRMQAIAGYRIDQNGSTTTTELPGHWVFAAPFALLALLYGVSHARRSRSRPRSAGFRPGESPQTALGESIAEALTWLRCGCGGALAPNAELPTMIRYEEGTLKAWALHCRKCGCEQTCYVSR
ncbi:MAG: DUF3857 domain-containing protein [Acidobacteria bacterium]|nr:DUF3857 domain-containing protein [Acidobacteriota bacterium]